MKIYIKNNNNNNIIMSEILINEETLWDILSCHLYP